jgi:hypothetical protein
MKRLVVVKDLEIIVVHQPISVASVSGRVLAVNSIQYAVVNGTPYLSRLRTNSCICSTDLSSPSHASPPDSSLQLREPEREVLNKVKASLASMPLASSALRTRPA